MQGQTISLMMSNVESIPGKNIVNSLGLVTGSTVRAKNIGKDIFAGFKNLVGGELKVYTELLNESRNEAIQRMMIDAHARGANGIVNVRFATSNVAAGASELFCYGTAVIVE
ncbi:MAG: YbjQ family protein [Candidatus Poseidoniales archaeon]|nr:MAG: YbjQ family protein [Candidatus Poseidoniales archaeon]